MYSVSQTILLALTFAGLLMVKNRGYWILLISLYFIGLGAGKENFILYSFSLLFMVFDVLWTYILTKNHTTWFYFSIPLINVVFLWFHYSRYVGVVNPRWFIFISTPATIAAIVITAREGKKVWKIAVNLALVAVVAISMLLFPKPTYTYDEGMKVLAESTGGGAIGRPSRWNEVARRHCNRTFPFKVPWEVYLDYYDSWYVYEVREEEEIAIYTLDPMTGEIVKEISQKIE